MDRRLFSVLLLVATACGDAFAQEAVAARPYAGGRPVVREARRPIPRDGRALEAVTAVYTLEAGGGRTTCVQRTTPGGRKKSAVELHPINHLSASAAQASAGLEIVLRATDQLEQFPEAKAAFIRAAERWESLIQNDIRIYIDVDFGPTRFGEDYDEDTIGSADSVLYGGDYSSFRSQLLDIFPDDAETQSLPATTVPTDLGAVGDMVVPGAVLRAIGLLPAIALGGDEAPDIGFNSAFPFDFDPSDGVPEDRTEFLDAAIHEIGHVLGFTSMVGATELDPPFDEYLSAVDLHRFRPNVLSFPTDPRILSSGGEQVFHSDGFEPPLSTGRPDGTGGDEQQAGHWKDDALIGAYVGIMDPTLDLGAHPPLTIWDLFVLNRMGYGIAADFNQARIFGITPDRLRPGEDPTTVTIVGEDFEAGSVVLWKGVTRAAAVVSNTTITLPLSEADLAAEGSASVEVLNPGSIPSNAVYFEVSRTCFRCPRVVRR